MNPRLGVLSTVANPKAGHRVGRGSHFPAHQPTYLFGGPQKPSAGQARQCPAAGGMDWRMAKIDNSAPPEAYTFDDVLLRPGLSEILPSQADVRTRITREIGLNIPIV